MTSSPQPAAKRPKKDRALLESIPTPSTTANSKFTRSLGSADPLTRKKAVTALQRWLELRSEVAEADLIVIWKGLFYCFWHSDLVPVQVRANHHPVCRPHSVAQEELASQLASILQHVKPAVCAVLRGSAMQHPSQVAYAYFSACMTTLRREWFGIDRHRIDKFLNLIREFVYHLFLMLHDAKWYGVDNVYNTLVMVASHSHHREHALVAQYLHFLQSQVLLPNDTLVAQGVAFQVADVWLAELVRAVGPTQRVQGEVLQRVLHPFVQALAMSSSPAMLPRITYVGCTYACMSHTVS